MRHSTQAAILKDFKASAPQILTRKSIAVLLLERRTRWGAPKSLKVDELISLLLENKVLQLAILSSNEYDSKTRFILGTPSPLLIASSFYKDSFLSHGTALFLHRLAPLDVIYVNHEQSAKQSNFGLSQASIDRAFTNRQRTSKYSFCYADHRIVFLNGKSTGYAGVVEMRARNSELLRVSDLERTLIDIVVRPQYAGGLHVVVNAFRKAAQRASVPHLVDLLRRAAYSYPYHQSLGLLLERSGLSKSRLQPLKKIGTRFKFYLDYGMVNPLFDPVWKVYFPHDLYQ